MRIAVLHRYPLRQVTGTNASFSSFLEQLSQSHDVTLVSYRDPDGKQPLPKKKGHRPIQQVELPCSFHRGKPFDRLFKTLLWMVWVPFVMFRLDRRHAFDLVYCDDSVPYYGFFTQLLLSRFGFRPRARVVIRLGDLQSGYRFARPGWLNSKLFPVALAVERFMWKRVAGVVAISNAFRRFLEAQGLNAVEVVRESIDLPWFDSYPSRRRSSEGSSEPTLRQRFGIATDVPIVMFHGALLPCKGVEAFIAAAERTVDVHPAVFVIAGGGSEEFSLRQQGRRLTEQGRLFFTGWYPHRELPGYIFDADIGVVMRSSNMANDFVVTTCLLEYWAARKPVIAPQLQAFEEVIEDGKHAVLYRPDDVSHLTAQLQTLLLTPKRWPSLGNAGRERAQELFSHEQIAADMVRTLRKLATAATAPRRAHTRRTATSANS